MGSTGALSGLGAGVELDLLVLAFKPYFSRACKQNGGACGHKMAAPVVLRGKTDGASFLASLQLLQASTAECVSLNELLKFSNNRLESP